MKYCEFGNGIYGADYIPPIQNVVFEHHSLYNDNGNFYFHSLELAKGGLLITELTKQHDDILHVYKINNKYGIFKLHDIENAEKTLTPIFSNPNLDFVSSTNNANTYGYVGTLENLNVKGDNILIDSIGAYVRGEGESPNKNEKVWCRLLKYVNNQWVIISQSENSKSLNGVEEKTLFTFKMVNKTDDALIKYNDKIAITYVGSEDADVTNTSIQLGFKTLNKPGGLQNNLVNESTGVSNWCPAFVFGYIPTSSKIDAVTLSNNQTINSIKTFNNIINIANNNNVKTVISNNIDGGELKVLHDNSNKGFIVRTKNTSENILPLEILTTNGNDSYQYNFPKTNGNIPVGIKINDTIYGAELSNGLIDLTDIFNNSNDLTDVLNRLSNLENKVTENEDAINTSLEELDSVITENEDVVAEVLVSLDKRIKELEEKIDNLENNSKVENNTLII